MLIAVHVTAKRLSMIATRRKEKIFGERARQTQDRGSERAGDLPVGQDWQTRLLSSTPRRGNNRGASAIRSNPI